MILKTLSRLLFRMHYFSSSLGWSPDKQPFAPKEEEEVGEGEEGAGGGGEETSCGICTTLLLLHLFLLRYRTTHCECYFSLPHHLCDVPLYTFKVHWSAVPG